MTPTNLAAKTFFPPTIKFVILSEAEGPASAPQRRKRSQRAA